MSPADPKFRPPSVQAPSQRYQPNPQYAPTQQTFQSYQNQQFAQNGFHQNLPYQPVNTSVPVIQYAPQSNPTTNGAQVIPPTQIQNVPPTHNTQPTRNQFTRQRTIELDENGDILKPNHVKNHMEEITGENIIVNRQGKGRSEIDYSSAMTGLQFDEQGNILKPENSQKIDTAKIKSDELMQENVTSAQSKSTWLLTSKYLTQCYKSDLQTFVLTFVSK